VARSPRPGRSSAAEAFYQATYCQETLPWFGVQFWPTLFASCRLSDQSLRSALAQGSQQTLHDRILLLAELVGMKIGEATDDGDRSNLASVRQIANRKGRS
jgi:hypothetical protein